jgi:hypothetical protein
LQCQSQTFWIYPQRGQKRGKNLLSEIQNQLYFQSVAITLAGIVIIYKYAEKPNRGIYPDIPLLQATYKMLYEIPLLTFIGHVKKYEGMSLWIITFQIGCLYGTLCSSDTVNVNIPYTLLRPERIPGMGVSEFDYRPKSRDYFYSIASRAVLGRTQHPV